MIQIDELRAWLLSFRDDETLNTELDFQFILPEPKSFNDQSTQTNENEKNKDSLEYFSASDNVRSTRKRLLIRYD